MVKYNPKVVEKWAARRYHGAEMAIIYWSLYGLISAFALNFFLYGSVFPSTDNLSILFLIAGLLIGLAVGLYRTLEIRAKAQLDLCMLQIEKHLRDLARNEEEMENLPKNEQ